MCSFTHVCHITYLHAPYIFHRKRGLISQWDPWSDQVDLKFKIFFSKKKEKHPDYLNVHINYCLFPLTFIEILSWPWTQGLSPRPLFIPFVKGTNLGGIVLQFITTYKKENRLRNHHACINAYMCVHVQITHICINSNRNFFDCDNMNETSLGWLASIQNKLIFLASKISQRF